MQEKYSSWRNCVKRCTYVHWMTVATLDALQELIGPPSMRGYGRDLDLSGWMRIGVDLGLLTLIDFYDAMSDIGPYL